MSKLWDDPVFKTAYQQLSPADKYKYEKIGQNMYNKVDFCDPKTVEFETVAQIELMLRDGMDPALLTLDEKEMFLQVNGPDSLKKYLQIF